MTFSLLFTRSNGSVAVLRAVADADGLRSWSSWTLTGSRVSLDADDKWLAVAMLNHEAKRLAAVAS